MPSNIKQNNLVNSQIKSGTKTQKNIYCISGLGADKRVFTKLKLQGYNLVHLDWLTPDNRENITDYANRLAVKIEDKEPILIGLSFGGIVAVEIAKKILVEKVILISSIKTKCENPWYFKIFRWLPIHLLIPFKSLLWAVYWLINWLFGLEAIEERQLLKAILKDTDPIFLKWAIDRVIYWQNQTIPNNIYHIHGESDRIFPITFLNSDIAIEKGGHFMVMNRADKISQIIERIIKN